MHAVCILGAVCRQNSIKIPGIFKTRLDQLAAVADQWKKMQGDIFLYLNVIMKNA